MSDEHNEADIDVFEKSEATEAATTDHNWVSLPSANLFSVADADEFLRWRPANLVAIVGERNGGKTTLVSEIYERYLRGSFADQLFTHSRTLMGFEQRSYQSRADTGAVLPDTPRTSANDELRFFHVGLTSIRSGHRTDLLISERAGEKYREARDQPATCTSFVEVAKARTVGFILDGDRVSQDKYRSEVFASVRSLIRAFSDAGAIPAGTEVQLITTKVDLLSTDVAKHAREALTEFEERLKKSYANRFSRITTWRTAARDPTGNLEPAWGVAPLLQSWLTPPDKALLPPVELPDLTDEFDRLLLRRKVAQ